MSSAVGGLLVALVMKYADNIVKGFAVAVSVTMTAGLGVVFFHTTITTDFAAGVVLVTLSIFNYNTGGRQQQLAEQQKQVAP